MDKATHDRTYGYELGPQLPSATSAYERRHGTDRKGVTFTEYTRRGHVDRVIWTTGRGLADALAVAYRWVADESSILPGVRAEVLPFTDRAAVRFYF